MVLFVPLRLRLLVVAWPCVGASRAGSAPDFLPGGSGGGRPPVVASYGVLFARSVCWTSLLHTRASVPQRLVSTVVCLLTKAAWVVMNFPCRFCVSSDPKRKTVIKRIRSRRIGTRPIPNCRADRDLFDFTCENHGKPICLKFFN